MSQSPNPQIAPEYKPICQRLEQTWYEQIPITKALGVRIAAFDGARLSVEADFDANINVHGTAFAGSLYAVNALCGWSMVHLQLRMAGLEGSIVLVEGKIRYAAPVRDCILSVCDFGDQHKTVEALKKGKKKARFHTLCLIAQDGQDAATFEGSYAVLLEQTVEAERSRTQSKVVGL